MSPVFFYLESKMPCNCRDHQGKLKNFYSSYDEAYETKVWSERQFGISLRVYRCEYGYWHLTSD
jgi:hypothetical protein